jgi:hypothetical protein
LHEDSVHKDFVPAYDFFYGGSRYNSILIAHKTFLVYFLYARTYKPNGKKGRNR